MHIRPYIADDEVQARRIFKAGQIAPPGIYREIDGEREVILDREDTLPASCNGHATVYIQRLPQWAELQGTAH